MNRQHSQQNNSGPRLIVMMPQSTAPTETSFADNTCSICRLQHFPFCEPPASPSLSSSSVGVINGDEGNDNASHSNEEAALATGVDNDIEMTCQNEDKNVPEIVPNTTTTHNVLAGAAGAAGAAGTKKRKRTEEAAVDATAHAVVEQVEEMTDTSAVAAVIPATPAAGGTMLMMLPPLLREEELATDAPLRGVAWDSLAKLEEAGFYDLTLPSSIKSSIWLNWRKLSKKHPKYVDCSPSAQFQCVMKRSETLVSRNPFPGVDDGICGKMIQLPATGKWYRSSNLTNHTKSEHKMVTERSAEHMASVASNVASSNVASSTPSSGTLAQAWSSGPTLRQKNERIRIALADFVALSTSSQSLSVCECPLLEKLLKACWEPAELPTHQTFRPYIGYQYLVFKLLLQIELMLCSIFYGGQAYAQLMHDGGTLDNHRKYENIALKFIAPYRMKIVARILVEALSNHNPATDRRLTVAELFELPHVKKTIYDLRTSAPSLEFQPLNLSIAFTPQGVSGTAPAVAQMMTTKFNEVTKMNISHVVNNSISDAAAITVAKYLGDNNEVLEDSATIEDIVDELPATPAATPLATPSATPSAAMVSRVCDMHNLSKVLKWALGTLTKSKNKVVRIFFIYFYLFFLYFVFFFFL
jgi:hypothetical protein